MGEAVCKSSTLERRKETDNATPLMEVGGADSEGGGGGGGAGF